MKTIWKRRTSFKRMCAKAARGRASVTLCGWNVRHVIGGGMQNAQVQLQDSQKHRYKMMTFTSSLFCAFLANDRMHVKGV